MKHQRFLILLIAIIVLYSCQEKRVVRPNVLFIMTDQHPLSCVGAYGNEKIKTPNIDRIAEEGVILKNYYLSAFACSPSRASILTGRFLHNHNVSTNNVQLDSSIPTLGTILSGQGYHTGYFGKAHLSGSMYVGRANGDGVDYMHDSGRKDPISDEINAYWNYERIDTDSGWHVKKVNGGLGEDSPQLGFKEWEGGWKQYKQWLFERGQKEFAEVAGNHDDLQSAPEGQHMYSKLGEEYHMAAFFSEKTDQFIRKYNDAGQPWAAVLSYFGPHLPVAPPQPWDTLYSLDQIPLPANLKDDLVGKPAFQKEISSQYTNGPWSDNQYKDYIRRYWGYTSYIDDQIGRVLNALEETDQWDNTIVVFTTDHGDMITAHGMIFKSGGNAYEELFHVPAIVRIPGVKSNNEIEALTSSIDLLPTILEACNIKFPAGIDGESLMPLLKDEAYNRRESVFAEVHLQNHAGKVIMNRNSRYKYVYHWLTNDVDELYDLQEDPGELINLFAKDSHQEISMQMREDIINWAQTKGHKYSELIAQKHLMLNKI